MCDEMQHFSMIELACRERSGAVLGIPRSPKIPWKGKQPLETQRTGDPQKMLVVKPGEKWPPRLSSGSLSDGGGSFPVGARDRPRLQVVSSGEYGSRVHSLTMMFNGFICFIFL